MIEKARNFDVKVKGPSGAEKRISVYGTRLNDSLKETAVGLAGLPVGSTVSLVQQQIQN